MSVSDAAMDLHVLVQSAYVTYGVCLLGGFGEREGWLLGFPVLSKRVTLAMLCTTHAAAHMLLSLCERPWSGGHSYRPSGNFFDMARRSVVNRLD